MKRFFVLVVTLGVLTGVAFAHNGMQHVMGTVTAITQTNITVKTTDGKTQKVVLTSDTKYAKGMEKITFSDIKVGDHVVIHAIKKGDQLMAYEVKVGMMHGAMGETKMGNPNKATPK